jgi:predicted permease
MPSAASLPIVAQIYKADNNFISQGVFLTHLFSIFTIPIWFSLWEIAGFSLLGA